MSDGASFAVEWGLGELSQAERRLCEAFARGDEADLRTGDPEKDDPQQGGEWSDERRVRATVIAALLLSDEQAAPGRVAAVRLRGARVTGELALAHAEVNFPLSLEGCWFEEPVCLDEAATRTVSLTRSVLPGLNANDTRIEGHLWLNACRMQRAALTDARISGRLSLNRARLTNSSGAALNADGLVAEGGVFCRKGFHAEGEIRLLDARIGGQLNFDGARLTNPGKTALNADRMVIEGGMFCEEGFQAEGEIRLLGARVSGQLVFNGARLTNPNGVVLSADGLVVEGNMFCQEEFQAEGGIRLPSARISGQLGFNGARLTNPGGTALSCVDVEARSLWLRTGFTADGEVDLAGARVGTLYDDPGCWSADLDLNELVYDDLEPDLPSRERLEWLRRGGKEYRAQPYEQLAAYYRRQGHDEEARRVLLAKQRRYRASRPWYARIFGYLLDGMVGYGYRPGRAAAWVLALLAAGSVFFTYHRPEPIKADEHPHYQPVLYAADVLLPIVNLGQESAFKHQGLAQWVASAMVLLGWLFATAVVAGVTRVLTRN
ncbi:hypothetical protein [Streptosporangium pseudovulgare]|uniref:Oxidoreductase n=1 Tax=Streptosporangium pseudovulgare TaxID=35765 RepID=A0ABQ2RDY6_9ACTN|nr:hypothetical protein [Streptosporangium pseudovulgare]GGQ27144.1 oxidoreductase [Streptosporangium pseudovulgare]